MLLKIFIYGYLNRIASSRRLERECQRNVELMWLTGRLAPGFVEAMVAELARRHLPGLATDMRTTMGALINEAQMNKTLDYIASGLEDGARLVSGGQRVTGLGAGFFVEPTIFSCVKANHRIAREEIFGPVLSVLSWSDYDELFDSVNGTEFGLTASLWTRDLSTAHRAAARVQAGYVWVNGCSAHIVGASFGGFKQSGIGREESLQELHEFTQIKNVNVNLQWRQGICGNELKFPETRVSLRHWRPLSHGPCEVLTGSETR